MPTNDDHESGADELRRMVRVLNMCREDAIDGYTAEELVILVRACWASDWDVLPDDLSEAQASAVLDLGAPVMFAEVDGRCGSILSRVVPIPAVETCACGGELGADLEEMRCGECIDRTNAGDWSHVPRVAQVCVQCVDNAGRARDARDATGYAMIRRGGRVVRAALCDEHRGAS